MVEESRIVSRDDVGVGGLLVVRLNRLSMVLTTFVSKGSSRSVLSTF